MRRWVISHYETRVRLNFRKRNRVININLLMVAAKAVEYAFANGLNVNINADEDDILISIEDIPGVDAGSLHLIRDGDTVTIFSHTDPSTPSTTRLLGTDEATSKVLEEIIGAWAESATERLMH